MRERQSLAGSVVKKRMDTNPVRARLIAWRIMVGKIITRLYISRLQRYFWRSLYFDTTTDRLVLGCHANEDYIVFTSDKVIGKLLYCRGDFDFQKFERALTILNLSSKRYRDEKEWVLYDIGANIGSIGIPALKRGYVDRVVAFEPDPDNFRLLRVNAILNGVDNKMDCYQVGLGAENGRAQLTKCVTNYGDHRIKSTLDAAVEEERAQAPETITVEIRKLDDFLTESSDYILWMDVQGYEANVLTGGSKAIKSARPIILEFVPKDLIESQTMNILVEHLTNNHYTTFYDLNEPVPKAIKLDRPSILHLGAILSESNSFTDILVV